MTENQPAISEDAVIDALRPVQDPELHRSIVDLKMVRSVELHLPEVNILIALTIPGCPLKAEIQSRVSEAVTALPGVDRVNLEFTSMNDAEREELHRVAEDRYHQLSKAVTPVGESPKGGRGLK